MRVNKNTNNSTNNNINKKRMLLIAGFMILLCGCRNQDTEKQEIGKQSMEEQYTESQNIEGQEIVETGHQDTAGDRTEQADESMKDEQENVLTDIVAMADTAEKVISFGDIDTMNHDVNGRNLPIYCVDREDRKVALSFDAAWGNEDTADILEILEKHGVHVTFFMTGGWVESYPDDVKAILEAGHDLGNHSENHKNMSQLTDEEKKEELMAVHRKVKELTGYEMFLFRPPYGDYDNALIDVTKNNGYYAIQWDVDSLDWKNEGTDAIIQTVTEHKNLGDGSIILCHNGSEYIVEALDTLLTTLENAGYEIVPVSELIYREDYHLNYEGRQIKNEM
ncbi:MAG: polysaccharide deacetylase family protein [Blautia sp.]|nr:polysaccharide deacetylase family protein [Lachnoclostridium sp.]MCM1210344.1 polysaccharide deacetylase family protein [Blautia sp.]